MIRMITCPSSIRVNPKLERARARKERDDEKWFYKGIVEYKEGGRSGPE